jgi:hypothetical protein
MLAISHHEPQNYHVLNLTAIRYAALIDMNKYPVEITKWPWDPLANVKEIKEYFSAMCWDNNC